MDFRMENSDYIYNINNNPTHTYIHTMVNCTFQSIVKEHQPEVIVYSLPLYMIFFYRIRKWKRKYLSL